MDFSKQIKKWTQKVEVNIRDVVSYTCKDLCEKVIAKTPVDTGRLKSNWMSGLNQLPTTSRVSFNKSGSKSKQEMRATLKRLKIGDRFYFVNNLVYAQIVEYGLYPKIVQYRTHKRNMTKYGRIRSLNGFSTLAPSGMVRISISEFRQSVRQAVRLIK